ncbi:Multidrug resistance protein abc superfamily [Globisporangium polare]
MDDAVDKRAARQLHSAAYAALQTPSSRAAGRKNAPWRDDRDDGHETALDSALLAHEREYRFDDGVTADTPVGKAPAAGTSSSSSSTIAPLLTLFSYADRIDALLMTAGTIGALAAGLGQPIQIILIGNVLNAFNPMDLPDAKQLRANVNSVALNFVWVGIGMVIGGFVQVSCWSLTASRQAKRIRSAYVHAILTKEIGWFDMNDPKQLATRIADSTVSLQEGMGRKVGDGIHLLSMGISGIIIGFVKGWELTLVLLAFTPLLAITAFATIRFVSNATQSSIASYSEAGSIAQEALENVRTVHMFNAISHFVDKYAAALESSTKAGIKKGIAIGWGTGVMFFTIYCTYAAGLYFGALQISHDQLGGTMCTSHSCYDGGKVMSVFFAVIMGAMALGQASPSVQAIYAARACAYDVFRVIKAESKVNPLDEDGRILNHVAGKIALSNITFAYPSRPDINVCSEYSLTIDAGETVALVGPSGSGKSTIVSLLERFYDPQAGLVQLDGVDIRELNVKWLRQQIGLVCQEPVLFATSILENIRHGCPAASDREVHEAARKANAFDFIVAFPEGFETEVGERGAQLSGGQKQRIAIARAIVKNPPILLLDEATSALDTESEHVVQESLDALLATSKRTTIIIAHRLSTIKGADRIAVHSEGHIVELGSHRELMDIPHGHYKSFVYAQNRDSDSPLNDDSITDAQSLLKLSSSSPAEGGRGRISSSMQIDSNARERLRGGKRKTRLEAEAGANVAIASSEEVVPASRIWRLSLPEWKFFLLGSIGAIINAAVFPVWGVILTKIVVLLFDYSKTPSELRDAARNWSLSFIGLGVIFGISIVMQNLGFAVAAQRLVSRVRLQTFRAMLRQEIAWFDLEENSSGALVSRLATDSAVLQAITAESLNQGLVNVTTLGIALSICFYYSWQMSLAMLAMFPIIMLFSYVLSQQHSGTLSQHSSGDADIAAGSLLSEAIGSIRTIASFGMEKQTHTAYMAYLDLSKSKDVKAGVTGGAVFGVSQGGMYISIAFLFWLGGKWVSEKTITFEDMFMVMIVLVLSTFAVGLAAQNATDGSKAAQAARNVFRIIDRVPAIDCMSSADEAPLADYSPLRGEIEFHDVAFTYPSRPDASIYTRYNLKVEPGQTVALVGPSGSGKSTAIALLERFYDPSAGKVTLDGKDIRDFNLTWLRERISLVSQEPVLFSGTIAENIAMGRLGTDITREVIVEAAKQASAHEFICTFPHGYDTHVGDRGAQVSGGQKQRIAIARAILRDPDVLLLDEATSALDSESERLVQESLDALLALKKRTTIIVAHRLSTVRNADVIAVTQGGAIVELGSHEQLMALGSEGVYRALVARQLQEA